MKTRFVTPEETKEIILKIAHNMHVTNRIRPVRFQKKMKENRGFVQELQPFFSPARDGLERKNPLVAALGDSVTAGHFEMAGSQEFIMQKMANGSISENDIIEIVDVRECYLELFRQKLIDYYEQTSVSVINSGIAGDTMYGMAKRLQRDVLRYQPDLVIINGSLNWPEECGNCAVYLEKLTDVVKRIKAETEADIIMLTPNMENNNPFANKQASLEDRVRIIRQIAARERVSLVDVYQIWESFVEQGGRLEDLLANGINHPSTVGHEVYAAALMQLFEE